MVVRVLVKGSVTTGLYGKVAYMEVRRVLFSANQNLACSAVGTAIFRSICSHWHLLPAELAIFYAMIAMYNAHLCHSPDPNFYCRKSCKARQLRTNQFANAPQDEHRHESQCNDELQQHARIVDRAEPGLPIFQFNITDRRNRHSGTASCTFSRGAFTSATTCVGATTHSPACLGNENDRDSIALYRFSEYCGGPCAISYPVGEALKKCSAAS